MREQSELKAELLHMMRELWLCEDFCLSDSERSARLRPEIMRRLLGLVMTDDERAADLGLPAGCRVRESAKIIAPQNLVCGRHCWFGENSITDASGGLIIGDHTTIASGVFVWTHSSALSNIMGNNEPGNPWIRRAQTSIGHRVFIGGPSVIYPGVKIGNGVIVMPMSVVIGDIPDNVVVAGVPGKVLRTVDDAWIQSVINDVKAASEGN
ncbi:DapH/DapD/GlmU-related protein [Dechloromonas sp. ARDL1]|uniref:acyltransferase n=1 Tax=Dechloromonas sp. ARDL1 TaxID=3322121 RepID=UPI003DA6F5D5